MRFFFLKPEITHPNEFFHNNARNKIKAKVDCMKGEKRCKDRVNKINNSMVVSFTLIKTTAQINGTSSETKREKTYKL